MHFQKGKFAQDKLVMLIKGEIDDYIEKKVFGRDV